MTRTRLGAVLVLGGGLTALWLRLAAAGPIGAWEEGGPGRYIFLLLEQFLAAMPVFAGGVLLLDGPAGERLAGRIRWMAGARWAPVAAACVLVILSSTVALGVYRLQPITNGDEYAYRFQAEILASGRLSAPAPPVGPAFTALSRVNFQGRWFSLVFPGHAFLLAPGILAGLPWLPVPLVGACGVLLGAAVARRLFDATTGGLFAWLMATSPHVVFMQGSLLSQTSSTTALLLLMYLALRFSNNPGPGWALAAGLAWTGLFLIRPPTAVTAGLVWLVWAAWEAWKRTSGRRRLFPVLVLAGAMSLAGVLYVLYNAGVSGIWFRSLYSLYMGGDTLGTEHFNLTAKIIDSLANVVRLNFFLLGWPVSLLFVGLWIRHGVPVAALRVGCAAAGAQVAFYMAFYATHYWYWHEIFIPALLITAWAIRQGIDSRTATPSWTRPRTAAILVSGLACSLLFIYPFQAAFYSLWVDARAPFFQGLPALQRPQLLVIESLPPARDLPLRRFNGLNDPDLANPRLFVIDHGQESLRRLQEAFPDRDIFRYGYDPESRSMIAKAVKAGEPAR